MEKLTLTISEAMDALGVSRPIINRYIRRKDNPLPCIKTCQGSRGGVYAIPRAALERWVLEEADRNSGIAR